MPMPRKPLAGKALNARRLEILRDGMATVREVAEYMHVDRHVVDDMINSGELPHIKIGPRQTRIPIRSVNEYLAARLQKSD